MNRVEEYIKAYTRNCSNVIYHHLTDGAEWKDFHSWLTPDHAREVAKIAKDEVIEKAAEWLNQTDFCHYYNREFIDEFKKAMKDE